MNLNEIGKLPKPESIPQGKRILLLLTGGYDSTLILHQCLNIANVDVVLIKGSMTGSKARYEERAVDAILKAVENYKCNYEYRVINVWKPEPEVYIGAMLDPQAVHWPLFTAGMYDPEKHHCIMLGYNYTDTGASNIESVMQLWELTFKVAFPVSPNVKIYLPLLYMYKNRIIDSLPNYLAEHIWTCEGVSKQSLHDRGFQSACGYCSKCVELISIINTHPTVAGIIFLQQAHHPLLGIIENNQIDIKLKFDWAKRVIADNDIQSTEPITVEE